MNSRQMLPSSKVSLNPQALRDLVACDYLALDCFVARVGPLADVPVFSAHLVKMSGKFVVLARL